MKAFAILAVGLLSLSACNSSPTEQKADNIEAAADNTADVIEEQADNATGNQEDALENKAAAVRDAGANMAKDVRTNDPDTNLANGM